MITLVPYNPHWPSYFEDIAKRIKEALQDRALFIHHIGSTSVPGMAAKDVIDVQVTVTHLDKALVPLLEKAGFTYWEHITRDHRPPGRDDIPEAGLTKMYFGRRTGQAVNLHIRVAHSFNQRYPLLCRDYLRAHPHAASAYEEVKRQLARHFPNDADAYYNIKDPVFDLIMEGAYIWAKKIGWEPAQG